MQYSHWEREMPITVLWCTTPCVFVQRPIGVPCVRLLARFWSPTSQQGSVLCRLLAHPWVTGYLVKRGRTIGLTRNESYLMRWESHRR